MQTVRTTIGAAARAARGLRRARSLAGCALFVCGCNTDQQVAGVPDVPTDYRMRHPITISESRSHAGALRRHQSRRAQCRRSAPRFWPSRRLEARSHRRRRRRSAGRQQQRACSGGRHARDPLASSRPAACRPMRLSVRGYHPPTRLNSRPSASAIRKIAAQAGPCGLWPEDIGPSLNRRLLRKSRRLERGLRHPAQSCGHGRQSGRSGAAARPKPPLTRCDARPSWSNIVKGRRHDDAISDNTTRPRSATLGQ